MGVVQAAFIDTNTRASEQGFVAFLVRLISMNDHSIGAEHIQPEALRPIFKSVRGL